MRSAPPRSSTWSAIARRCPPRRRRRGLQLGDRPERLGRDRAGQNRSPTAMRRRSTTPAARPPSMTGRWRRAFGSRASSTKPLAGEPTRRSEQYGNGILPKRACSCVPRVDEPPAPRRQRAEARHHCQFPSTREMPAGARAAAVERDAPSPSASVRARTRRRRCRTTASRPRTAPPSRRSTASTALAAVAEHASRDVGGEVRGPPRPRRCVRRYSAPLDRTTATASTSTSMSGFLSRLTKNDVRAGSVGEVTLVGLVDGRHVGDVVTQDQRHLDGTLSIEDPAAARIVGNVAQCPVDLLADVAHRSGVAVAARLARGEHQGAVAHAVVEGSGGRRRLVAVMGMTVRSRRCLLARHRALELFETGTVEVAPEVAGDVVIMGVFAVGGVEHRALVAAAVVAKRAASVEAAARAARRESSARRRAADCCTSFRRSVRFGVRAQHRCQEPACTDAAGGRTPGVPGPARRS